MVRVKIQTCFLVLALIFTMVLLWVPGSSTGSTVIIADIDSNTTWTKAGGPYLVALNIHVKNSNTLTIQPGTNVRFAEGVSITVDMGAKLLAKGNETAGFIIFNATDEQYTWNGIVLQSSGNEIVGCNFSQGNPGILVFSSNNIIENCTFTDSPKGITIQSQDNTILNSTFKDGVTTGISLAFSLFNTIENCKMYGVQTGIDLSSSSHNNNINSSFFLGGDTSISIDASKDNRINDSAMLNNKYCIQVTGNSQGNSIRNSTMLVSTEYVIKTSQAFDASSNFWGILDDAKIASLISGAVVRSNPLATDPVGINLPTISTATTWSTNQQLVGGLLVTSNLVVNGAKVTFADPDGYNFIYVTGSLILRGATVDNTEESCTIFYAPGSTGEITDSNLANGFTILGFTPDLPITGSTFTNGTSAIVLRGSDGTEISDCEFQENSIAVKTTTSKNLVIKDNTLGDGINLNGADSSQITGNQFDTGYLILTSSNLCGVSQNNFSNYNSRSVLVSSSSKNLITDNVFYNNREGIRINPGSSYNNITYNDFNKNLDAPVYILSSDMNYIYHNNFYSSFLFSSIDNGQNYWNNSMMEGNYWSEYKGVDDGSDDRVLGDGIGDTIIPFMSVDSYPFINPFGWLLPKTPLMLPFTDAVDIDGTYNVSWESSENSLSYIVQESTVNNFATFGVVYNRTGNQVTITGQEKARYYYRVLGVNDLGNSSWSNIISILVNKMPTADNEPVEVRFDEDAFAESVLNLSTVFSDPDGDLLLYSYDEPENMTIEVHDNGFLDASSAESNWFGEEDVKFYATDGMFTVNKTIKFVVDPLNDPPGIPSIALTPGNTYLLYWELTNLSASCTDIDTDQADLTFTWFSNISGFLYEGAELLNLDLDAGVHLITLNASDGDYSKEASIEITKQKRPYVPPITDDDDTEDNTGTVVAVLVVLGAIILILAGAIIYFMMRRKAIEKAEELSKEQAEVEKEAKIKKIKKVKTVEPIPGEEGDLMPGEEMPEMGLPDEEEIGPVGPVMEEDGLGADGDISPDEKQKMLDELDELLFADEISEEDYIQRVNEIENM
jgi:parallel beta-helix repeat protein